MYFCIHIKSAYVGTPKLTGMMHRHEVIGPSNSIFTGSTVPQAISITDATYRRGKFDKPIDRLVNHL